MLNSDLIAALNESVTLDNPLSFGLLVRTEIVFLNLYEEGKEEELSAFLEYLQRNYPENYFDAAIQALTDFLLKKNFLERVVEEYKIPLNSICQSLVIAGGIDRKSQLMAELASQVPSARTSSNQMQRQFKEIPAQRKIVKQRNLLGKLKVFASWFLIWNTIHQILWDILFALVLCNLFVVCTSNTVLGIRFSRTLIAVCTSIAHISIRMNNKAKQRWKLKYE